MATVAVSIVDARSGVGDHKEVVADVTLTGSYIVGGETVTKAQLKCEVELIDVDVRYAVNAAGTGWFHARYNPATNKVQLFGNSDGTAAVNESSPEFTAVALPGGPVTVRLFARGKGKDPAK